MITSRTSALGVYRVKNEARWIKESLERTLAVADRVILFDDHSTDNTREIARSFKKVKVVESPFEGLDEARDKDYLFKMALEEKPDWVVFLDGDEAFTKTGVNVAKQIVTQRHNGGIWSFRIIYLWNSRNEERIDGVFGRFYAPRIFALYDQKDPSKYSYLRTGLGGNFHCGQVPQGYKGPHFNAQAGIMHFGYIERTDRERKFKWYNQIDPGNKNEGEYVHMIELPDQHAPGPVQIRKWADA